MSRFNGYLRTPKQEQSDPLINPHWRELTVGDWVQSLVDSAIEGKLQKVKGTIGYLERRPGSLSLRTLRKVERSGAAT